MDAFTVLGVERTGYGQVDMDEVRKAYRAACIRWHPDKHLDDKQTAELRFKEIQEAFRHLSMLAAGGEEATRAAAEEAISRAESFMTLFSEDALLPAGRTRADRPGQTKLRIGDGVMYIGEAEGGQPHGEGELILKDGSVHTGSFDGGRASGRGILYTANGTVHKGEWRQNRRSGVFEVIDSKGGRWHDVYDDEGKRVKRTRAAVKEEEDAAAAAAEAAAAVATLEEVIPTTLPSRPVTLTVTRAEAAAARAAEEQRRQALERPPSPNSADLFARLTPEQRRVAAERRRLAGAAIRAERARIEGGGFAGYSPPASPRAVPSLIDGASLFARYTLGTDAGPAVPCRRCGTRFHVAHNCTCRYHNSEWMEVPPPARRVSSEDTMGNGGDGGIKSTANSTHDATNLPEGGMWRCCGSRKQEAEGCTLGRHEPLRFGPQPESSE
jgi:hypothetical protein